MGSILPWHPMAEKGRRLLAEAGCDTGVSDAQIVIQHLHVARKLGSPILRCVAGNLFTRDEGHDMAALADQVVAILREACRAAEDLGMKIAMENHADFTVRELASILARVEQPGLRLHRRLRQPGLRPGRSAAAGRDPRPPRPDDALQELPHHPHADRAWPWRTARWATATSTWWPSPSCWRKHNPQINLNIEIHSQFAPFRLDILERGVLDAASRRRRATAWPGTWRRPGRKPLPDPWPDNLPDGTAGLGARSEDICDLGPLGEAALAHLLT